MVVPINIGATDGSGNSLYAGGITQVSGPDNINFVLAGGMQVSGALTSNAGTASVIILSASGMISALRSVNLQAGNVVLEAAGGLQVAGSTDNIINSVNITVGNSVVVSQISTNLSGGNNGVAITLVAGGSIYTGELNSSGGSSGNGGAITITAGGSIYTGTQKSSSYNESGAAISLVAGHSIYTGDLNSSTYDNAGGAITVTAGGSIYTGDLNSSAYDGTGGAITVTTGGSIYTGDLNSSAYYHAGGAITVTAGGAISAGNLNSSAYYTNAGTIVFTAGGAISAGNLNSSSTESIGSNIIIASITSDVTLGSLDTAGASAAGSIGITAAGKISVGSSFLQANNGSWSETLSINASSSNGVPGDIWISAGDNTDSAFSLSGGIDTSSGAGAAQSQIYLAPLLSDLTTPPTYSGFSSTSTPDIIQFNASNYTTVLSGLSSGAPISPGLQSPSLSSVSFISQTAAVAYSHGYIR